MKLKMLSLFSGIGGIDLAAEWAGIETVAFCEINEYCQNVLHKHWPEVKIYSDVRTVTKEQLQKDGIEQIDILCGGFPCQPFSVAGERKGQEDERYLWPEMLRVVDEVKPMWILGENVAGLLSIPDVSGRTGGTFGTILYDLAQLGYSVGWCCYGAYTVGAPHERERVFILAYSKREPWAQPVFNWNSRKGEEGYKGKKIRGTHREFFEMGSEINPRLFPWEVELGEPKLVRVDDGVPNPVERSRALGNAVVPQQIYPIFKAIADIMND